MGMKNQPPLTSNISAALSRAALFVQKNACSFLGLMFPWQCPGCQCVLKYPEVLCDSCALSLVRIRPPYCGRCGTPFPPHWTVDICSDCHLRRSRITKTRSVFLYEGLVRQMIRAAKFSRRVRSLQFFAEECYLFAFKEFPAGIDALVPIPMHHSREWERTFNQADLVAATISRISGIPVCRLLNKARTLPQSSLSGEARRKNLRGIFSVRARESAPRSVLLIDDVITTGTTLEECARVLRAAGAKRVYAITIARSVLTGTLRQT